MKKFFILIILIIFSVNIFIPIEYTYASPFSEGGSQENLQTEDTASIGEIPPDSEYEEAWLHFIAMFVVELVIGFAVGAMMSGGLVDISGANYDDMGPPAPQEVQDCYDAYGWASYGEISAYVQNYINTFTDCTGDDICEDICEHFQILACAGQYSQELIACLFTSGNPEWGCEDFVYNDGTLVCS